MDRTDLLYLELDVLIILVLVFFLVILPWIVQQHQIYQSWF